PTASHLNQASHSGKKRSGKSNPPILFVPPRRRTDMILYSLFTTVYHGQVLFYTQVITFLYASNNFVISGGFQNREDAVYWAQNTKHACLKIQSRANKKENAL
ncbi:MAG TPA: hypothetical protein PLT18_01495, partial [Gemmiger qucibialis]|nr:hypothetical protein [Gemmiger qucibialis]